jgi:hypothetical protein
MPVTQCAELKITAESGAEQVGTESQPTND